MHELALAEAVVAAALDAAEREGLASLEGIGVRVGELQRITRDVFEFALREVLPAGEPRLAGTRITLEVEPARLRCRACARAFALAEAAGAPTPDELEAIHFVPELAHGFLRCPACGSPDFQVLAGRGVSIAWIRGSP